jgi:GTP-binding protein
MFVDRVVVYVKGGDGGKGMVSFHREKYVPRGGPDGGDGGDGGSILVKAVAGTDSLAGVVPVKHWRGENGRPGGGNNRHGAKGKDRYIVVPPGTIVRDRHRGYLLKDLTEDGQEVCVARGGRGGRGNRHFATSVNRSPRFAEPGEPGEERCSAACRGHSRRLPITPSPPSTPISAWSGLAATAVLSWPTCPV